MIFFLHEVPQYLTQKLTWSGIINSRGSWSLTLLKTNFVTSKSYDLEFLPQEASSSVPRSNSGFDSYQSHIARVNYYRWNKEGKAQFKNFEIACCMVPVTSLSEGQDPAVRSVRSIPGTHHKEVSFLAQCSAQWFLYSAGIRTTPRLHWRSNSSIRSISLTESISNRFLREPITEPLRQDAHQLNSLWIR